MLSPVQDQGGAPRKQLRPSHDKGGHPKEALQRGWCPTGVHRARTVAGDSLAPTSLALTRPRCAAQHRSGATQEWRQNETREREELSTFEEVTD